LTALFRLRISFNTLNPLLIASLLPVNQLGSLLVLRYCHLHQPLFLSIILLRLHPGSLVMILVLFQRCVVISCI